MSEYEGKVPYRNNSRNVDLIDVLYYEATGEMMSREEKEKMKNMIEDSDEIQYRVTSTEGSLRIQQYPPVKFTCTINASDERELRTYLKANDYLLALQTLEENLRRFYKHGLPEEIETLHDLMDKIREMFYKTIEDYGIDLIEGN